MLAAAAIPFMTLRRSMLGKNSLPGSREQCQARGPVIHSFENPNLDVEERDVTHTSSVWLKCVPTENTKRVSGQMSKKHALLTIVIDK